MIGILADAEVLRELTSWWNVLPNDPHSGGNVDVDNYSALYEKLYFHIVPPTKWVDNLDRIVEAEWNKDRKNRSSLSRDAFMTAMVRILCQMSNAKTADDLIPYLRSVRTGVIDEMFKKESSSKQPHGARGKEGTPPTSLLPKKPDGADKWSNIKGILDRIEQRQYENKTRRQVIRRRVKKPTNAVFEVPTTPMCPRDSWCLDYYNPDHTCAYSHHCRAYPCPRMNEEDHMANFHHTNLNHAHITRPPTAELAQGFGFEENKTPQDALLKKVKNTQRLLFTKLGPW